MQWKKRRRGRPHPGPMTVRPVTRLIALVIIPFLVSAFIILYFFPEESGRRFAWEIRPAMTAIWMGAGYLGGAFFFLRVALTRRWHRVSAGFWPVTAFTWAMLLVTLLHWSRFDLSHRPFQVWLGLYVVTPLLVPLVWWANRRADGGAPEMDDQVVPRLVRAGMTLVAAFMAVSCLAAFAVPDVVADAWPWALTPLTARVLGGWFALMAVGALVMARESRWSAWRHPLESIILVWHGLVLVGALAHAADFKPGGGWFVAAEAAVIAALLALYVTMQLLGRRRSRTNATPSW